MTRPLFPALLAAAALAGCAASADPGRARAPAVTAAPAWQTPLPHAGRGADLARWWTQFDDPVLPALIAAAQQASPTLASAQTRIERARANLAASAAQRAPRLDAEGTAQQGRSTPGTATMATASLGLQASWELDLFGGLAAAARASTERLREAEAGWHDARVSLAADVASAYVNLRACEAQLAQSRDDAQSREHSARLLDESARAGFTAAADAALARAGAAQARSQARAQQALCDTLVKGLVELTDRDEPALRTQLAATPGRLPSAPAIAPSALPAQLLTQRPDLAAAQAAVQAAASDVAATRADELPRVRLSGLLAGAAVATGGATTSGAVWSLGPLSLSLPLADRASRRAATQASQAAYDEAVVQLQGAVRRALREVETALVALDSTAARERDVLSAAGDFEASLTATAARQRAGLASLLDLEAARRNAVQARSTLIELQRERASAWVTLYRSLGGGWSAADKVELSRAGTGPAPMARP